MNGGYGVCQRLGDHTESYPPNGSFNGEKRQTVGVSGYHKAAFTLYKLNLHKFYSAMHIHSLPMPLPHRRTHSVNGTDLCWRPLSLLGLPSIVYPEMPWDPPVDTLNQLALVQV